MFTVNIFFYLKKGGEVMTEKQKKFADEYLIDLNATRAYKSAYPNVKKDESAGVNGSRLLKNAKVKEYIEKKLKNISDNKIAETKEIMINLTNTMRNNTKEEVVVVEKQEDGTSRAIKVKKDTSIRDRLKAAELLGKRYGLFTDKLNIESNQSVVIVDDVPNTE